MPLTNNVEFRIIDEKNLEQKKLPVHGTTKENIFKGTFAISVVYGAMALIFIILALFYESFRDILFNKFLPFTLVFIIGTILIIMFMLYFIFTYTPVIVPVIDETENISCPDYWKLETLDDDIIKKSFDSNYPINLFKYKCVMDTNIFDKNQMFIDSITTFSATKQNAYKYTNVMPYVTSGVDTSSNDTYDNTKETNFKNNSIYGNLYKNINGYTETNIGTYINTASDDLKKNTMSNLRKVSLLHNNYKFNDDGSVNDLIISNINYSQHSNILSPILWNYNKTSYVGIGTTAGNPASNVSAIILDWGDLTPKIAFNNANNNPVNEKERKLYIYYNCSQFMTDATAGITPIYKLGEIIITSNIDSVPEYSMYFTPTEFSGLFNRADSTTINIVQTRITTTSNATPAATFSGLSNVISSITNYPKAQLYVKVANRPDVITKANISDSNLPLLCDEIYPALMASLDKDDNNNNVRCAYSKICGIPWSDLRCEDTTTQ